LFVRCATHAEWVHYNYAKPIKYAKITMKRWWSVGLLQLALHWKPHRDRFGRSIRRTPADTGV